MRVHNTTPERFWSKVLILSPDECWPWQGALERSGHARICWDGIYVGVHRIAWMLINGPIPSGIVIRHRCDNPPCCNPDHLLSGTQLDNIADRVARGRTRSAKGTANPFAKLTDANVVFIREQYAAKLMNQPALARKFNVSTATVCKILHGIAWKSDDYVFVPNRKQVRETKLTAPDVVLIRDRYAAGGISQSMLAREFGVSKSNIWLILHGERWAS